SWADNGAERNTVLAVAMSPVFQKPGNGLGSIRFMRDVLSWKRPSLRDGGRRSAPGGVRSFRATPFEYAKRTTAFTVVLLLGSWAFLPTRFDATDPARVFIRFDVTSRRSRGQECPRSFPSPRRSPRAQCGE